MKREKIKWHKLPAPTAVHLRVASSKPKLASVRNELPFYKYSPGVKVHSATFPSPPLLPAAAAPAKCIRKTGPLEVILVLPFCAHPKSISIL